MRRGVERQRDFAEALLPEEVGRDEVLERVDALIDRGALEAVCKDIYAAPVGRPSYPLRLLIKAMLVQAWWDLSDPKAEQLLRNDLRFRRFLGVGLTGKTPDRNTLWRFRDELAKRGLAEALLGEVDRQLRARDLVMRRGSIVDATLVRSAASSKNRRRDGTPVDRDADWAARRKSDPTLGYKLHAAVDEDTGIVRRIALTPASRHERTVAEAVVPGDVGRVWADAAYDARDLRDGLGARGITAVIAHNPRRRGLRPWQRAANFVVKTVRPRIEPVFGSLKRSFGLARARCFSLARNLVDTTFRVLAFDLRRAVGLSPPAT
ncbi:MAG: IS5 family transposase [Nitrospiraceae bacterium]|nr:MAG: IS5 family transposase [Nitrospiraceae bacterium]